MKKNLRNLLSLLLALLLTISLASCNDPANTTESKIPETMARAFPELIYSPMPYAEVPPHTLYNARASAEPSNPKTNDTVVDVGKPSEL